MKIAHNQPACSSKLTSDEATSSSEDPTSPLGDDAKEGECKGTVPIAGLSERVCSTGSQRIREGLFPARVLAENDRVAFSLESETSAIASA